MITYQEGSLLRRRTASTAFKWVKGHEGTEGYDSAHSHLPLDTRNKTNDDIHVLSDDLITQVKIAMFGDVVQDVRDSSAESSKTV